MTKRDDLVGGLFWLCIGLLLGAWAKEYEIGSLTQPGPGLLPSILAALLVVLSAILLGRAWRRRVPGEADSTGSPGAGWKRICYVVAVLFAATLVFEPLGYFLTIFLLIALLMLGTGPQDWKQGLLAGLCTAVGVHFVFVRLLAQPFPLGILGF